MNNYCKRTAFIIMVVLNLCSWELYCSADSNHSPNNAVESGKKSRQEMLLDPSVPESKKTSILMIESEIGHEVPGSILTNLIMTSSNESLKVLGLINLGHRKECTFAPTFLADFARNGSNSDNTRWVAIEGLAFFTNRNVSEALCSFATNRDMDVSFRIRGLKSLMKCQPVLYESVWQQIKMVETNFALFVQPILYPERRNNSSMVLDKSTEEKLRNKFEKQEGEAAFSTIQELSKGKSGETVKTLIKRYGSESEKNKGEIALSLVKIAKRETNQLDAVRGFLVESKEKETSEMLKRGIQYLIDFLNSAGEGVSPAKQ